MGGIYSSFTGDPSDSHSLRSSASTSLPNAYQSPLNSANPMSTPENETPIQQLDSPVDEGKPSDQSGLVSSDGGEGESAGNQEEEEEGECGFCLFMKGGGCRDTFIDWENCIEEAENNKEDVVEKCVQATAALKKCMEAHSDYYEPILRAEKAAEQEAIIELEKEKEAAAAAAAKGSEKNADKSDSEPSKVYGKEEAPNKK